MMIDLSAQIYDALKKAGNEYTALKNSGDLDAAKRKAAEIANLYKQLAEMSPATRNEQLNRAKRWSAIARGTTLTREQSGSPVHTASEKENAEKEDEALRNKIDALLTTSSVKWKDIGGLDRVKQLLMETVVIAGLKKPDSIKPWKGILLFGPPGTGKTLLAAAAAGSLDASFYDVKSESILSKYFGESSKLITQLYDSAREHSPSIVFIDEFDSLTQSRDGEASEASRRVLSTLLTELDGLADKKSSRLLLTLAATNTPWDLDSAVLSRFPRRIYVPLPDAAACESIIKIQTSDLDVSKVNLKRISETCSDMLYSGRDLSNFCQQAVWNMIHDTNRDLYKLADMPFEKLQEKTLKTRPLTDADFEEGWKNIKSPLTKDNIERYEQWSKENGEC